MSFFALNQVDVIKFIRSCGIEDSQISVFTPYTAQKVKIAKALNQAPAEYNVETLSVYASQGTKRGDKPKPSSAGMKTSGIRHPYVFRSW